MTKHICWEFTDHPLSAQHLCQRNRWLYLHGFVLPAVVNASQVCCFTPPILCFLKSFVLLGGIFGLSIAMVKTLYVVYRRNSRNGYLNPYQWRNSHEAIIYGYLDIIYQIWLVVSTPLKNMKVNGKDDISYMKWNIKAMFQTTNQKWIDDHPPIWVSNPWLIATPAIQNIGPDSAIPTWTPSPTCGSHGPMNPRKSQL